MEARDVHIGSRNDLWDRMEAELEEVRQRQGEGSYSTMMRVIKAAIDDLRK